MLLLTGVALNEILTAEWMSADWKRGVINLPDSKIGAKPVYLSDAAFSVLERQKKSPEILTSFFRSVPTERQL